MDGGMRTLGKIMALRGGECICEAVSRQGTALRFAGSCRGHSPRRAPAQAGLVRRTRVHPFSDRP